MTYTVNGTWKDTRDAISEVMQGFLGNLFPDERDEYFENLTVETLRMNFEETGEGQPSYRPVYSGQRATEEDEAVFFTDDELESWIEDYRDGEFGL